MLDVTAEVEESSNIVVEKGDTRSTCNQLTPKLVKTHDLTKSLRIVAPNISNHLVSSDYEISKDFCAQVVKKFRVEALARPVYVIQEHHATRLHWDLRFEIEGALKSWALPKGAPEGNERRLAIQVPNHPIEYAAFEGNIPEGNYGAGKVKIWVCGTFELELSKPEKILVKIHGRRLEGRYCLLYFKPNENNWLFFKTK